MIPAGGPVALAALLTAGLAGYVWGRAAGLRIGAARSAAEMPLLWRAAALAGRRCPICGRGEIGETSERGSGAG